MRFLWNRNIFFQIVEENMHSSVYFTTLCIFVSICLSIIPHKLKINYRLICTFHHQINKKESIIKKGLNAENVILYYIYILAKYILTS